MVDEIISPQFRYSTNTWVFDWIYSVSGGDLNKNIFKSQSKSGGSAVATTTTAGLDPYARAIGAEEFQRADWVESNVLVPLNTVPYDKSRSLKSCSPIFWRWTSSRSPHFTVMMTNSIKSGTAALTACVGLLSMMISVSCLGEGGVGRNLVELRW